MEVLKCAWLLSLLFILGVPRLSSSSPILPGTEALNSTTFPILPVDFQLTQPSRSESRTITMWVGMVIEMTQHVWMAETYPRIKSPYVYDFKIGRTPTESTSYVQSIYSIFKDRYSNLRTMAWVAQRTLKNGLDALLKDDGSWGLVGEQQRMELGGKAIGSCTWVTGPDQVKLKRDALVDPNTMPQSSMNSSTVSSLVLEDEPYATKIVTVRDHAELGNPILNRTIVVLISEYLYGELVTQSPRVSMASWIVSEGREYVMERQDTQLRIKYGQDRTKSGQLINMGDVSVCLAELADRSMEKGWGLFKVYCSVQGEEFPFVTMEVKRIDKGPASGSAHEIGSLNGTLGADGSAAFD